MPVAALLLVAVAVPLVSGYDSEHLLLQLQSLLLGFLLGRTHLVKPSTGAPIFGGAAPTTSYEPLT
jgi:hypothetical protein